MFLFSEHLSSLVVMNGLMRIPGSVMGLAESMFHKGLPYCVILELFIKRTDR